MASASSGEVTQLLQAWGGGDGRAQEKLTPLVYDELHRAAQRFMARQAPDYTLQATALVNEVYLTWSDSGKRPGRIAPISLRFARK